jgi:hypothetical protein
MRLRPIAPRALAVLVCFVVFAAIAPCQEEPPEPSPRVTRTSPLLSDQLLPQITAAIQTVTTADPAALRKALHIDERPPGVAPGAPPNALSAVGDLDGDGVPELLLQWVFPEVEPAADVAPDPDSRPLWSLYLLSWTGANWKASRLLTGVEDFKSEVINPGPPIGRALALVTLEGGTQIPYPAIFQVKDHEAVLLWDAQADDSRYEPLLQGSASFLDHKGAPTVMLVTGRADPGLLQIERNGKRGFSARAFYSWSGTTFAPDRIEYAANQDYTIYRFISALHLHDYAGAYALVVPTKFLKMDSPTVDKFRQFVQDHWPEFLQDEIFAAPELPAGSSDEHLFVLSKPDKHYLYHPVFSRDGKFRLTGLRRTVETLPTEP